MATKPSPKYKGNFILNVVDTPETYILMEEHDKEIDTVEDKYIQENEFYLVPDKSQFVNYDSEPTEGSSNLVTSGGIYNSFKDSIDESNQNYLEAKDAYIGATKILESSIDDATELILSDIENSTMTAKKVDDLISQAEIELLKEEAN